MAEFFEIGGREPRNDRGRADRIAAYLEANPSDLGAMPPSSPARPGFIPRILSVAGRAAADEGIVGPLYQQFLRGHGYDPDMLSRRVPERFTASPYLAEEYRRQTEDRGVMPVPGGQLARRPIDAMGPEERARYASDWERMDAGRQAAYRAMSAPAKARYAQWREGFERHTEVPPAETTAEHAADLFGAILAAAATPEGFIGYVPSTVNTLATVRHLPSLARDIADTVNGVVRSYRNRLGRNPTEQELRAAMPNFSQRSVRPYFQDDGRFPRRSIWSVRDDLRAGRLDPAELPLRIVKRDGQEITLDNRSLLALRQARVDPARFSKADYTGVGAYEADLTKKLRKNDLGPTGTDVIRIEGPIDEASLWRPDP